MSPKPPQIDPREVLRAEIAALPGKKRSGGTVVTVDFLPGAYGPVIAAAKARRMSVPAYVRRAAYAMAAHDLEIDVRELLARDPRVSRETNISIPDPDGTKFGSWVIIGLEGGRADDA